MAELTEADALEIWLVLDLIAHNDRDDRLQGKARDLLHRLRTEGKIAEKADG